MFEYFLFVDMLQSNLQTFFQIYMDFDEIRKEIEAETERISGNNKVFWLPQLKGIIESCQKHLLSNVFIVIVSNSKVFFLFFRALVMNPFI